MLERFKEVAPEAAEHEVELKGYGLHFAGNSIVMKACTTLEGKANFPLKKGGTKLKKIKQNVAFNYCPFCGTKYPEIAKGEA